MVDRCIAPCSDGLVTWHFVKTFTTQACGDAGTDVQAQRVLHKTMIRLCQFLDMLGIYGYIWEHTVRKLPALLHCCKTEPSAQSE